MFSAGCLKTVHVLSPSLSSSSDEAGLSLPLLGHPWTCLLQDQKRSFLFIKETSCAEDLCRDLQCSIRAVAALERYGWAPDDLKAGYWFVSTWEEVCFLHPRFDLSSLPCTSLELPFK